MSEHDQGGSRSRLGRFLVGARRWPPRLIVALFVMILTYGIVVLIGLIPVNNDFEPTENGIEIFVASTAVHTAFVLPITSDTIDWRDEFPDEYFSGDVADATHIKIGWGDQGFYLETPTWADLKYSTVGKALFLPTKSCLQVTMARRSEMSIDMQSVVISEEQYSAIVDFVRESFRRNKQGEKEQIAAVAYSKNDAFFESRGSYHCFNTCNNWAGNGMKTAGLPVGCFTPLPKTPLWYLPTSDP